MPSNSGANGDVVHKLAGYAIYYPQFVADYGILLF